MNRSSGTVTATRTGGVALQTESALDAMETRIFDVRTERDRVHRIWRALESNLTCQYFLSQGWVETWLDSLPHDVDLKLVAGFSGETPVWGCFAGVTRSVRNGIIPVKSIYLNATGKRVVDRLAIEYNRIVASRPLGEHVWRIFDELDGRFGWDEIVLPGADGAAEPVSLLQSCPDRWKPVVILDEPSPYVDLARVRETDGGYLALLSRNTRSQMRRCYRAYETAGPVELSAAADTQQALDLFAELVDLHQASWARRGRPGGFDAEYLRSFHRDLIRRRFDSGEIQLLRVTAGGAVVGCLYNFIWNGHVLFYQGGLSEAADKHMKPGWLCHAEAITHNARAGHNVYDFLAGDAQYKNSLATDRHRIVWMRLEKRKLRFLLEGAGRAVKRYLRSRLIRIRHIPGRKS